MTVGTRRVNLGTATPETAAAAALAEGLRAPPNPACVHSLGVRVPHAMLGLHAPPATQPACTPWASMLSHPTPGPPTPHRAFMHSCTPPPSLRVPLGLHALSPHARYPHPTPSLRAPPHHRPPPSLRSPPRACMPPTPHQACERPLGLSAPRGCVVCAVGNSL